MNSVCVRVGWLVAQRDDQRRQGVALLAETLAAAGFLVSSSAAPDHFLANPLTSQDQAALELHFNELEENTFTLYSFTKVNIPNYSSTGTRYGPVARAAAKVLGL
jgi:hypothetical protein